MNKDNDKQPSTISQFLKRGSEQAKGAVTKVAKKEKKRVKLLNHLLKTNMLVHGSDIDQRIRDEYRKVKRPLVSNAVGRSRLMVDRGNVILVTSSVPGEGKSYTSLNLALSMANEMDNTVLLVDGDITRQGLSKSLGIKGAEGLIDALSDDEISIGDVMLHTDIPKLNIVSAGKVHNDYVAELLASQRMADLINELASRYSDRIVVIDGPPMLPTPQTQILAGLVGQVVFVIEAGKTPQALVTDAIELIPEEQAVGLILNKNEGLSSRGGYGYGYGYGYYASDKEHPK
jgi:exopolysaccharide/PEP-CTERM locus tyrosine autokinase